MMILHQLLVRYFKHRFAAKPASVLQAEIAEVKRTINLKLAEDSSKPWAGHDWTEFSWLPAVEAVELLKANLIMWQTKCQTTRRHNK